MTGGWFVSSCQGEFEDSAAAAVTRPALFFGGSGFSGRNACALTTAAQVNNISTTTVLIRISGFIISFSSLSSAEEFRNMDSEAENPAENNPPTQIRLVTQLSKKCCHLSRRESPDNRSGGFLLRCQLVMIYGFVVVGVVSVSFFSTATRAASVTCVTTIRSPSLT
jgi:hypothetical protein